MKKINFRNEIVNNENLCFDKFIYINNHTKSEIICKQHGSFYRTLKQIRLGILCDKCLCKITSTYKFIDKSKNIHGDKYNYNNTNYINSRIKVVINCPLHGDFKLFPIQHLRGQGCKLCKRYDLGKIFIEKSSKLHNFKYDYSKVKYFNNKTPVEIICKKHGIFKQRPDNHISNFNGCPKCSQSIGEKLIINFLYKYNFKYEYQKRFTDCRYIQELRFDFYVPDINTCIEYNGIQHYEPVKFFGGRKIHEYNIIKDDIKYEFCKKNNIRLIKIKYNEDVEKSLYKNLLEYNG